MSDLKHALFVWHRLVCVLFDHDFTTKLVGSIEIAFCSRCNWYGGPTGAINEPSDGR